MAHVCYDDITHLFGLPLVRAPEDYEMNFSYLADTPLFFFELVEKLNRGYSMDRRICFLTDYTLNIANENGKVSRCCKVEDIRELIVDERKHAVGVRMRDEPFALGTPKQGGIFYDMPVDLYLRCSNAEMLKRLLRPLSVIFRHQTQDVLPVRPLREKESLDELLVVAPNGRRIKYPPMQYHNKRDVERAQRRDADDVFDRSSPRQYAQPCEEGGGPVYSRSRSGWRSEPRSVRNEEVVVTRQSCLKSPNAEEQRGGRQSSPRESGSRGGRGEHDDSEVHHLRRRLADQDRLIGRLQRENSAKQHDLDEMHSRSQQPTQGRTSEGKSVSSANNRQRGKRDSATAARRSDSARRSGSKNRKTSKQHPRSGSPRSHSHRAKSRSARNTKSPSARPRVTEVNEGRIYREEPPHSPPPQQQQQQAKLQVLQDQIDTQSRQIEALQQQLYVEVSGRQEMEVRVLRHYRDLPLPLRQDITEAKLAHQLARKRAGESYWRDQDEQRERELHDLLYSLQQAQFAKEKEEQQRRANESHYTRNNTSSAPYNGINASNNYNRQATTYTQRGGSQDVTELQRQLRALQDEVMGLRERLRAATFRY